MFEKLDSKDQIRQISDDINKRFSDLKIFKHDKDIVLKIIINDISNTFDEINPKAYTGYLIKRIDFLKKILLTTLVGFTIEENVGKGTPQQDDLIELYDNAIVYSKAYDILRFIYLHGDMNSVRYDSKNMIVKFRYPSKEAKYLELLNAESLEKTNTVLTDSSLELSRALKHIEVRCTSNVLNAIFINKGHPIEIAKMPGDVIEDLKCLIKPMKVNDDYYFKIRKDYNLNGIYSFGLFCDVFDFLFMLSIILRICHRKTWFLKLIDINYLKQELHNYLQVSKSLTDAVIEDLIYKYDNLGLVNNQPLLMAKRNKILFIPLHVEDRVCSQTYIELSKKLYNNQFQSSQELITKDFEDYVGSVISKIVPFANVESFEIRNLMQIDKVISSPDESIMIITEIKHLTAYNNSNIVDGLKLTDQELIIENRWDVVSSKMKIWEKRSKPRIVKLLITNWFRGTIGNMPKDIIVMNIEELNKLGSFENLKDFVNEIYKFIIKVDDVSVPTRFDKFSVLGYTFYNEI